MISPRNPIKSMFPNKSPSKLPQIQLKGQIRSAKKHSVPTPGLQPSEHKESRDQLSINKQNNFQGILKRKSSLNEQIKARISQIQAADRKVKDILGVPQVTFLMGGDMTNFEYQIQQNRELIRRHKNNLQYKLHVQGQLEVKTIKKELYTKPKFFSSKQISQRQFATTPVNKFMELKMEQNDQLQKVSKQSMEQMVQQSKIRHKSEKRAISQKIKIKDERKQQEQQVFKSIKLILSGPQKTAQQVKTKKPKQVKFSIAELQNRLRKLDSHQTSQSEVHSRNPNKRQTKKSHINPSKSAGTIPTFNPTAFEGDTFKNWNNTQDQHLPPNSQQTGYFLSKVIKYHRGDFQNQLDQIKRLEVRSYKSIQKMIENKKLLVDLRLLQVKIKAV